MKHKEFYVLHSDLCKTLSNPKRQEILDNLRNKELTVNKLVEKTGIAQANLSQHLAIMRSKGIVQTRRKGINIFYSITNPKIIKAYDLISEVMNESFMNRTEAMKEAINLDQEKY